MCHQHDYPMSNVPIENLRHRTLWDDTVLKNLKEAIASNNYPEVKRWYHSMTVSLREFHFDKWEIQEIRVLLEARCMISQDGSDLMSEILKIASN